MDDQCYEDNVGFRALAKLMKCAVCGSTEKLVICDKCGIVRYCGREHQKAHWADHKKACGTIFRRVERSNFYRLPDFTCDHPWVSHIRLRQVGKNEGKEADESSVSGEENSSKADDDGQLFDLKPLMDILDPDKKFGATKAKYTTNSSQLDVIESCYEPKDKFCSESIFQNPSPTISTATAQCPELAGPSVNCTYQENVDVPETEEGACDVQAQDQIKGKHSITNEREFVDIIVENLMDKGYFVYDNFLGADAAVGILKEACTLEALGLMYDGMIYNGRDGRGSCGVDKSVRSDKVRWMDQGDAMCPHFNKYLERLDNLMVKCRHELRINIDARTKAMITCYPGDGTRFLRHVDNSQNEGDCGCITSVYYLNKDWDVKEHGGVLCLFPTSQKGKEVRIEPILDRQVFFWSDKRNPHEVRPCFGKRFAVTLWYYEARKRTLSNLKYQIEHMEKVGAV